MDNEVKELLKQQIELSKHNNVMLTKLLRAQRFATIYRIVYWSIIILSTVGAFYFIKPYLGTLFNVYSGGVSDTNQINTFTNSKQVQDFIKSFK